MIRKAIFFTVTFLVTYSSNAQVNPNCAPKGITTEPGNSVNNELPTYENNTFFNWSDEDFDINSTKFPTNQTSIKSPFSVNAQNFNVEYLADAEDYKPEDGWELLSWGFGFLQMVI